MLQSGILLIKRNLCLNRAFGFISGEVNNRRMFIFNLSSVMATEKVFSAEVHLFKKKMKTRVDKTEIEVMMYQIAPLFVSHIGVGNMPSQVYGWRMIDATQAVKRCLNKSKKRNHLFGIYFRSRSSKNGQISLKKFEHRHSRPFLVVYSNDTQNITVDHIQPRFTPRDLVILEKHLKHVGYQGDEANEADGVYRDDLRKAKDTPTEPPSGGVRNNGTLGVFERYEADKRSALVAKSSRDRRSIIDNEVPQIGGDQKVTAIILPIPAGVNFPKTHPGILQGRGGGGGRSRRPPDLAKMRGSTRKPDRQLIPYPKDYKKKQRRRRRKNRRRNRQRSGGGYRKFDDSVWDDRRINEATGRGAQELCQKRQLAVDFADIGWNEWIINPKSFQAHYCAGTCPFPLTKVRK